jgi:dipeptidyl aminopeptidase/acylaminoacyl peptidase
MPLIVFVRRAALAAAFLAVPFNGAAAQTPARRAITHEDVWLMKRMAGPAVSPDGRWVVLSVTEPSYTAAEQSTDLWIVPVDGSAPARRLTSSRGGEGGVAWSPDSRRIAFSAQREGDEASQIYVLDVAGGGESQRVTNSPTAARAPRWRPDGRAILFTADVYPGAATDSALRAALAERRTRRWNARVYDYSPVRLWDRWLDDRRPSLFVQPLEPAGPARNLLGGTTFAAQPGFGGQLGNGGEELAAAWTPDGSGIVFAATVNRHEWAHAEVTQSLWLVAASGRENTEPRRLTTGRDDYGNPRFRPDGRALLATMSPDNERTFNHTRLVSFAWPAAAALGAPTVVAGGAERSVGPFETGADSRFVYFLSEDAGHTKLFRAPAGGGETREIGTLASGTYAAFALGGTAPAIAAVWESAVNPPELGRIDPATGRWTALTNFNVERAARIDWQPLREFWFTSSRGKRIRSYVALPPAFDSTRRYPLFVVIHGGPASMWTDAFVIRWNYHLLGAPGYVVLLTDYTGSTGYGERFGQEIQFDPLEGPANEVNEAADEAIRRYPFIDATRQVAGGASYGGHLANWLAVTTTRYRALISHAGLWDLESQWATSDYNYGRERNVGGPPWEDFPLWRTQSPMRRAANLRTPVLVTVGERDYRVPYNNALEFWTALQRQRVPSRLIVFPEENHWILRGDNSRFFYREVHAWIARWVEAGPATSTGR